MSTVSTLARVRRYPRRSPDRSPYRQQRGAVAIIAAVFLLAMIGTAAFAIDFGRWFVVKNELQNASDAAALAGAGHLYPPTATGPNWSAATTAGSTAVPLNASDRQALSTGIMVPGYWNYSNQTFDTDTGKTQGTNELPALRVTIERSANANMGPVAMTFGRIFGTDTMDASATATAVVAVPGQAGEGTLAPYAIANCLFNDSDPPIWDQETQRPVGDPPIKFVIATGAASGKSCNGCACGQWTSFDEENAGTNRLEQLIQIGNQSDVNAVPGNGVEISETWIAPGEKNSLYNAAAQYWEGRDIRVVVVDDKVHPLNEKGDAPVLGFACIHVHEVIRNRGGDACKKENGVELPGASTKPGANSCIIVSLSESPTCRMPGGGSPSPGPYTGVSLPPRLVQ